jgi:hypothetical protein
VSEFSGWEDMPSLLAKWLQSQDGLKINGVLMSSTKEVETAFYLLHCQDKSPLSRDPGNFSIVEAATLVATAYIREITSSRGRIVEEGTIPGKPGQVIYRKCSMCKMSSQAVPDLGITSCEDEKGIVLPTELGYLLCN